MKFGHELEANIFPEWRSFYFNYKLLKCILFESWGNYPYKSLFKLYEIHIENNPDEPFQLFISSFHFTCTDSYRSSFSSQILSRVAFCEDKNIFNTVYEYSEGEDSLDEGSGDSCVKNDDNINLNLNINSEISLLNSKTKKRNSSLVDIESKSYNNKDDIIGANNDICAIIVGTEADNKDNTLKRSSSLTRNDSFYDGSIHRVLLKNGGSVLFSDKYHVAIKKAFNENENDPNNSDNKEKAQDDKTFFPLDFKTSSFSSVAKEIKNTSFHAVKSKTNSELKREKIFQTVEIKEINEIVCINSRLDLKMFQISIPSGWKPYILVLPYEFNFNTIPNYLNNIYNCNLIDDDNNNKVILDGKKKGSREIVSIETPSVEPINENVNIFFPKCLFGRFFKFEKAGVKCSSTNTVSLINLPSPKGGESNNLAGQNDKNNSSLTLSNGLGKFFSSPTKKEIGNNVLSLPVKDAFFYEAEEKRKKLIMYLFSLKNVDFSYQNYVHQYVYSYQITVSFVISAALRREIETITKFYITQSRLLSSSALFCVDVIKSWNKLTTKERVQVRIALRQIYLMLDILQQYCDINFVAVGKILKKIDKVTCQNALRAYKVSLENLNFRMGRNSRINAVQRMLLEKYARHAAEGNLKKAHEVVHSSEVAKLGKESIFSLITWSFLGGIIATLFAMIFVELKTMGERFPGLLISLLYGKAFYLSTLPLMFICCPFLFSINVLVWENFGINFAFMFELDPVFHWSGIEVMRDSFVYLSIWFICVYGFLKQSTLDWKGDNPFALNKTVAAERTSQNSLTFAPLFAIVPLCILVYLTRAVVVYKLKHQRPWMACTLSRILLTPFNEVKFSDFFIADQLTSLVEPLYQVNFYACTFHSFDERSETCVFRSLESIFVLSLLPNLWRLMQCIRRYVDEPKVTRKKFPNLVNAGKYFFSLMELVLYMIYHRVFMPSSFGLGKNGAFAFRTFFFVIICISSVISNYYKFFWDVIVDAGIWINNDGKGYKLRKDLVFRTYIPYLAFIPVDFVLRSLWIVKLSTAAVIKGNRWAFALWSLLEIIRRFFWNFMRIENEHVNNTENYRATRLAPLPVKQYRECENILSDDVHDNVLKMKQKRHLGANTKGDEEDGGVGSSSNNVNSSSSSSSSNNNVDENGNFFSINPVNLTSITRFFASLPEKEKLKILKEYPDFKDNEVVSKFCGKKMEKKSLFYSELPEETKVLVLLNHLKDETMAEYSARIFAHAESP